MYGTFADHSWKFSFCTSTINDYMSIAETNALYHARYIFMENFASSCIILQRFSKLLPMISKIFKFILSSMVGLMCILRCAISRKFNLYHEKILIENHLIIFYRSRVIIWCRPIVLIHILPLTLLTVWSTENFTYCMRYLIK